MTRFKLSAFIAGTSLVVGLVVLHPRLADASYWGVALSVLQGGTGSTTASGARTSLSAAASGANSDITSLGGISTPLSVGQGGTGSATVAAARTALGLATGTCTLNGGTPSTCVATVPSGSICLCVVVSAITALPASPSLSGTTLTCTAGAALTNIVNYQCVG